MDPSTAWRHRLLCLWLCGTRNWKSFSKFRWSITSVSTDNSFWKFAHWYCHALCKISKWWLAKWAIRYEQTRIGEIWDILYCNNPWTLTSTLPMLWVWKPLRSIQYCIRRLIVWYRKVSVARGQLLECSNCIVIWYVSLQHCCWGACQIWK